MIAKTKNGGVATLADVSRTAGVSIATASTVLNRPWSSKHITPATRERVRVAAAALRYRPNLAARALVSRRMQTVGVAAVVDGGELSHYFLEIFNGIVTAAAQRGQNTTAFTLRDWQQAAERIRDFCDGRIDGMILLAPTFTHAQVQLPAHIPFVSIHANSALPGVVNIESDEEAGAFALTQHLIARGHWRIMHLAGPAGLIGAERRISGYKRALAAARIPLDRELLVHAGYTAALGCEAMRAWLQKHAGEPLPHAVFCANDAVAIGCSEALAEVGLRVPADISVAGFDDSFAARAVVPQLTSVRQPLREMGARAVELLLARIGRASPASAAQPKAVVFPVELAPRASVGAAPRVEQAVPATAVAAARTP
ncbi:MAG: LacI family DNA-binding transcriptional regulator [Opitutae bacterium]|nr:LacI family DNA-binding transcriptional regulator [Opitutae bacterium]